jgi:TolB-like protein/DNA-binding SARP family transcriptional activator/Tfp pilus assembly protein PilF
MTREPATIALRLLGGFDAAIRGDAEPAVEITLRISARKGRCLLAYLALQPEHRARREQLATLLWGDRVDLIARQSLRQCLLKLRRELQPAGGEVLAFDNETVRLDAQRFHADALDFARAAASDDPSEIDRAAELYRGELLADHDLEAEEFDAWLRAERSRLAALAASVFALAAEHADAAGDGARAVAMAERLVALDPLNEDSQRRLLRMCARHQGRDAALVRAKAVAELLRKELGGDPEDETAELIETIRLGGILPAPKAWRPRPAPLVLAAGAEAHAPVPAAPSRRLPPWVALASIAAVLVVSIGSLWFQDPRSVLQRPVENLATPVAEADSWQSPGIVPNAALDQKQLAGRGIHALVVLPFSTENGEGSPDRKLADRITNDLINDLSRVPSLRVIARQTSRLYAGRPVDVAAIGKELGVHYVVDGSLRMHEGTARIDVALIDAETRLQVWSDRFERKQAERFAVQDEIARGLARRLQVKMMLDRADRREGEGVDPAIDALLARGWAIFFRSGTTASVEGGDTAFQNVLTRDPGNVSALIGLAAIHLAKVANLQVEKAEPALALAKDLLERAVEKNPNNAAGHYFLGLHARLSGNLEAALRYYRAAIELNPSLPSAYAQIGRVLIRLGQPKEALDHVRYAIRLSPRDPGIGNWNLFGGLAHMAMGDDDAAIEWLSRALTQAPRTPAIHAALAAAFALKGDHAEAGRRMSELRKLVPDLSEERMMRWFADSEREPGAEPRFLKGLRTALQASS